MLSDATLCAKLRRLKVGYDAPDQIQNFAHMAATRIDALLRVVEGLGKELEAERESAISPNPMAAELKAPVTVPASFGKSKRI